MKLKFHLDFFLLKNSMSTSTIIADFMELKFLKSGWSLIISWTVVEH